MKKYIVEPVRFDKDGNILEGYHENDEFYISEAEAVEEAKKAYNELHGNDRKNYGYMVNRYVDDEYDGSVFEASYFIGDYYEEEAD